MFFRKILRRFGIWLSYLSLVAAGFVCFLFFRAPLNFVRIRGRKNIPKKGNGVLFLANHDTMYDSFLIGGAAFFPRMIFFPAEPFINFAARENYFRVWYIQIIMKLLRAEPVNSRDQATLMKRFVRLIKERNLLIFYQGGRSKNLSQIKDGPAFAIRHAKPTPVVIPVFHEGMDRIFSRGGPNTRGTWRWLPRNLFRRPTVMFGAPIDFSYELTIRDRGKCTIAINDRIVEVISSLRKEYHSSNASR